MVVKRSRRKEKPLIHDVVETGQVLKVIISTRWTVTDQAHLQTTLCENPVSAAGHKRATSSSSPSTSPSPSGADILEAALGFLKGKKNTPNLVDKASLTMGDKGFSYYFNSTTMKGRANVAKATLAGVGAVFLYYKAFGGKKVRLAVPPRCDRVGVAVPTGNVNPTSPRLVLCVLVRMVWHNNRVLFFLYIKKL